MAKKIQLQDANGNVLHPLTLGECVTMDNGENLDTLMSKSQMFTPTITQDKSMFKVGTGVDVDYSANVKDGAYESLVFKGKSLVNVIGKITVSNNAIDNRDGSYTINKNTAYSRINIFGGNPMIKVNTPYYFTVIVSNGTLTNLSVDVGTNVTKQQLGSGKYLITLTEESFNIAANRLFWYQSLSTTSEETVTVYPILVEYQQGMENWDIPYFTGICDSKMPILRNIGKNLFDVNLLKGLSSNVVVTDGIVTINNAYSNGLGVNGKKAFWFLKPNKTYRYSCTVTNTGESNGLDGGFYFAKRLADGTMTYFSIYPNRTVTIPSDWDNYTIAIMYGALNNNGLVTVKNMQFEEANVTTAYEDHKTNILRTSEEIVLREVNGVQDTYNALTGEYVQRIGEIVVTNTVSKSVVVLDNNIRVNIAMSSLNGSNGTTKVNNTLSDKFYWSEANAKDVEGLRVNGNTFHWCVSKNRLTSQDLQGVNTWLQSNPVTIQYELAEPITTIIKPSTMTPFAYQNGHVIVESGFEGQSLLPEIEYSVVAGRTGQVTQNTKVLRQQEQQIIGLEELLLTQVVQMEYERTLLQFDYELQMMMLG